ncbi:MAG: zinc-ribbon domain-containing protein [Pseudomonadota bacterium]
MRLICPNCGAQYEVPEEVIPETGRDVQCSDCGDTWFQHHPDFQPPQDEEEPDTLEPAKDNAPLPHDEDYGVDARDHDTTSDNDVAGPESDTFPPDPEPEPQAETEASQSPAPDFQRRELDADVAEVLRQEAEREAQARSDEERGGLETQQELGLQEADRGAQQRSEEARARMARLRGTPEPEVSFPPDDDIDPASRRNLLPDIEEISSSLGPESAREDATQSTSSVAPVTRPKKNSFRSGFRLAIVLAVLALLLYVFAPQIANTVPALADPMIAYVEQVNAGRAALGDIMQNLAASLSEDSSSDG